MVNPKLTRTAHAERTKRTSANERATCECRNPTTAYAAPPLRLGSASAESSSSSPAGARQAHWRARKTSSCCGRQGAQPRLRELNTRRHQRISLLPKPTDARELTLSLNCGPRRTALPHRGIPRKTGRARVLPLRIHRAQMLPSLNLTPSASHLPHRRVLAEMLVQFAERRVPSPKGRVRRPASGGCTPRPAAPFT